MSGYFIGLFWNSGEEDFDFTYTDVQKKCESNIINTSKIEQVNELKTKTLHVEIHNIRINKINKYFCDLNIEFILFNRCKIESIENLSKITGLKKIIFIDCDIKEFGDFKNSNIEHVSVHSSNISFTDICKLKSLNELHYKSCKNVIHLDELTDMKNLLVLDLNDNNIESIEKLAVIDKLISIDFGNNKINSIHALEEYDKLKYVYLNNNNIMDLSYLKNNLSIKFLNVSGNKISNIDLIEKFVDLEFLNVNNNPIKIIPNLLNFKLLDFDYLKVDWNDISELKGMKGYNLIKNIVKSITNK